MGKIAVIFGGQGSQYVGMGRELYQAYPSIRPLYDRLGPRLRDLAFEGELDQVSQTQNLQGIMLAFQLAGLQILQDQGLAYQASLGLSLGEYASLVACGLLDAGSALDLVLKRGQWMDQEAQKMASGMLAVLKLGQEELEDLLAQAGLDQEVYLANINSSRQIVLAGPQEAIHRAQALLDQRGYPSRLLAVAGAFHTPYMAGARAGFVEDLKQVRFGTAEKTYYPNRTGRPYGGEDLVELLADQMVSPVLLHQSLVHMVDQGLDHFVEIGPGQVLGRLVKREFPGVRVDSFKHDQDLLAYIERKKG